ncbi:hypothetical protein BJ970_005021 [Saccharopolyspora phatthalungensis]|uniref:Uncharacterized protein n=2 Tax=Saccharopolyspora phatthalungensis TaxID=664693 RepID=A0A840QC05_9PSEU|nr:hypothetical protein [Saccharopolyspora phatthalungensis]
MVAREDREFLARVARINQALAACALPLINGTLDATDSHWLGTELIAIGRKFVGRSHAQLGTDAAVDVVDGETVSSTDSPYRTNVAIQVLDSSGHLK